jgi:D-alanyl-D-alanine carboxypeptidase (penicillin-binding protein 5/6)
MSRLSRALLRPARPLRTLVAGCLLAIPVGTTTIAYAAGPAPVVGVPRSAAGLAAPAATTPVPTPSCKEWQTVTQVPLQPGVTPTPGSTATPKVPTRAVCRNAPPKPFPAPAWDPATVVGGAKLAATGVIVDKPDTVPAPPVVEDVSYVIADMETGEILAAKSPHAWLRPASTLKTLTALTLLPLVSPNFVVTATDEQVRANGTRAGMIAGSRYKAGSLFDAMLMLSANDAVYALTDAVGGYDQALELMNAKAKEIGAYDTVAVDPSGLDEDGQHSSAYDLALIGRAAMQREDFRGYVTKRQTTFPGGVEKSTGKVYPAFQIPNINDLLGHYPGAIGIKPGRTNRAQYTFIGAATRDGRTLIVSQMGSTSGSWKHTAALLDWGFAHADAVTPIGRLVEPGEAAPPAEHDDTAAPPSTAAPTPRPTAAATGTPAPPQVESTWSALRDDFEQVAPLEVVAGALLLLVVLVLLAVSKRRRRRRSGGQRR